MAIDDAQIPNVPWLGARKYARSLQVELKELQERYDDLQRIEQAIHERLAAARVNIVNRRREFFRASPVEVKAHLAALAGELLEFTETPEALEYRQCLLQSQTAGAAE